MLKPQKGRTMIALVLVDKVTYRDILSADAARWTNSPAITPKNQTFGDYMGRHISG